MKFYSKLTGEWNVEGKSYDRSNLKAYNTYGTKRVNAYKIIEDTLNMKDVRVFDYTHSTHDRDTDCPVGERYSEAWIEDTAYKAIGQMLTLVEKKAVKEHEQSLIHIYMCIRDRGCELQICRNTKQTN